MFKFIRRRKAVAVLENEICLERYAISGALLDIFITKDGNEYDAAIKYVIGRARAVDYYDGAREALVLSELILAKFCVKKAMGNQEELIELIERAIEHRKARESEMFSSFESWLQIYKRVCGEVNPMLSVSEDGKSRIDFMDHEGVIQAYSDRYSPVLLARQFAPTFHPDTFGR